MNLPVIAEKIVGGVLLRSAKHDAKFWLTAAQARCAASFMLAEDKTPSECVTFSAGHKSAVEIATCGDDYTIIFSLCDELYPELVTVAQLAEIGLRIQEELS